MNRKGEWLRYKLRREKFYSHMNDRSEVGSKVEVGKKSVGADVWHMARSAME